MRGRFRQVFPISIHALREEGDPQDYTGYKLAEFISIHALREEGDRFQLVPCGRCTISIHALREEGDARQVQYP